MDATNGERRSATAPTESKHERPLPPWTLVTSHGLVLLYIASNSDATIRETAQALGYTERRVADIIRDLATANFLLIRRRGRRNHYTLNPKARFRHPFLADIPFRAFVTLWRRSSLGRPQGDAAGL